MGRPHTYYKRAIQRFAHSLAFEGSEKIAKEMLKEESEEKLKTFILEKKRKMKEKCFYYEAGRVAQCVLEEAYKEGCDQLNASISGINMFEDFLGIREDLEE